ncbi:MAG: arginine--tRNA ligase [Spirochaetales bacterium]|nr:arginine--tRNA ligase [Spirochaetales bacterium]
MKLYRDRWRAIIVSILEHMADDPEQFSKGNSAGDMVAETPPNPELGDIAFPMFGFAKRFRKAPQAIAAMVADEITRKKLGHAEASGPYVNIKLDKGRVAEEVIAAVNSMTEGYGAGTALSGKKIMVEFSCPNTNKPLHLGHMRNDSIGESIARILEANGADVRKVNLINDRGIHICKSMLAYKRFGKDRTPESEHIKSDHFVGNYYVRFNEWVKEDSGAEEEARYMLKAWESGDPGVRELWDKMNRWAIEGIKKTYENTGISFDSYYFESETYRYGRDEILKGLEKNIFHKKEDNSVWVDLSDDGLDQKVLLRGDGTSLYITQDIGTAIQRHRDWPFDRLIYVVASEQNYHFQVLFKVLGMLGFGWADNLFHLSYGMVNLPHGKMKSREGTVVDADNLLEELIGLAENEIRAREREKEIDDIGETSKKIALGALNYYLLSVTPNKDMIFNPSESISFTGNTGPYLQYTGARISSILKKFEERKEKYMGGVFDPELLSVGEEWEIVKLISLFPEEVEQAAEQLNPSVIAMFLYELARLFSRYYHDNPVLHNERADLVVTRIGLLRAIKAVFKKGFDLLAIPFLEKM